MAQTHDGGKPIKHDLPYSPPVGPIKSPQGTNHGTNGTQGRHKR